MQTLRINTSGLRRPQDLGITEFMLRFMAWLCLRNDDYKNSQIVIVVGPNQDLAIKLIKRMKTLFEPHNIYFDSKETVIELNGCSIQAYPSNNLGSFRSLTSSQVHTNRRSRLLSKRRTGRSTTCSRAIYW